MEPFLLIAAAFLLALGALAGLLAGLFGIGGGIVLVPGMYYIFQHLGYNDLAMHLAVGTSLLTIILTGLSSAHAHYRHDGIDFHILKVFAAGSVLGVAAGTALADWFNVEALKAVFAISQLVFGAYFLLKRGHIAIFKSLPPQPWTSVISAANACLATLMGVGGGVQNVLVLTMCSVKLPRAVATASALGVVTATLGAAGFAAIGWDESGLPPFSVGYLSLPAFLCITLSSVLSAPLGARLAHHLPTDKLRKLFSLLMLGVAAKMIVELI